MAEKINPDEEYFVRLKSGHHMPTKGFILQEYHIKPGTTVSKFAEATLIEARIAALVGEHQLNKIVTGAGTLSREDFENYKDLLDGYRLARKGRRK